MSKSKLFQKQIKINLFITCLSIFSLFGLLILPVFAISNYNVRTNIDVNKNVNIDSIWQQKVSATDFNSSATSYISTAALDNGNVLIAYSDDGNFNYGTFVIYDNNGDLATDKIYFREESTRYLSAVTFSNNNILIAYNAGNYGAFIQWLY